MQRDYPIVAFYTRSAYPSDMTMASIAELANTGVNTLIISGINKNVSNDGIVYNDPPFSMFDKSGKYVGDPNWPMSLKHLVDHTNITYDKIYISVGWDAVDVFVNMADDGLKRVLGWLVQNHIHGIDIDLEGLPRNPATDKNAQQFILAAIDAGLALTAAPYTNFDQWVSWCKYVTNHNGTLSWLNLQCYEGGAGNNPIEIKQKYFPDIPIVVGLEVGNLPNGKSALSVQEQLRNWQQKSGTTQLSGAFLWLFNDALRAPDTVHDYAQAMYTGLTGNTENAEGAASGVYWNCAKTAAE